MSGATAEEAAPQASESNLPPAVDTAAASAAPQETAEASHTPTTHEPPLVAEVSQRGVSGRTGAWLTNWQHPDQNSDNDSALGVSCVRRWTDFV